MEWEDTEHPTFRQRVSTILERVEGGYLKILRGLILLAATLLILYAAGLAIYSLYRINQSPDSVQEAVAAVAPQELIDAEAPAAPQPGVSGPVVNPRHQATYDRLLRQYYQIFRTRFEPFRRRDDRQLSLSEFDDNFVNTGTRLAAIGRGELDFTADSRDLQTLIQVIDNAATLPQTQQRLQRYRGAQRVRVCTNVRRMRTTYRESWDPYSVTCANWYEAGGCLVRRPVQTPVTERACNMQLPEGTQSHSHVFRAYQNRFYSLLNERRAANAAEAESERTGILQAIAEGHLDLTTALYVLGGFVVLMFFFLLIAIERHQRRLASGGPGPPESARVDWDQYNELT